MCKSSKCGVYKSMPRSNLYIQNDELDFLNTSFNSVYADSSISIMIFWNNTYKLCINRCGRQLCRTVGCELHHVHSTCQITERGCQPPQGQLCQSAPKETHTSLLQKQSEITWSFSCTTWEKTISTVTEAAEPYFYIQGAIKTSSVWQWFRLEIWSNR